MNLLLIDNYDSFVFNVYQYLLELGHNVSTYRNDEITVKEIEAIKPDAIFLSPGPGRPENAGICVPLIKKFAGEIPIFGICLGHQAIGYAFGGEITNSQQLFHGKTSKIISLGKGVMNSFDQITVTRYHSLTISNTNLPDCLEVTCETELGEIMGVLHKEYNIEGVQFHPESVLTEFGKEMLSNFLARVTAFERQTNNSSKNNKRGNGVPILEQINDPPQKLSVEQDYYEVKTKLNHMQIFEIIQKEFGATNSFLLDSAGGPEVDCATSYIGIFPKFEITLYKKRLQFKSDNNGINEVFKNIFGKHYLSYEDGFDISNDKFSDVFEIMSNSFDVTKKHDKNLPISHGLVGFIGYEYLHYLENIHRADKKSIGLPDIHLKYFSFVIRIDESTDIANVIVNRIKEGSNQSVEKIIQILELDHQTSPQKESNAAKGETKELSEESNILRDMYLENARKAKDYIYQGDIFQVQLGQRIKINKNISSLCLYKKMREINPSPYMFYWDNGDYQLISNSPELQLRVEYDTALIRPIAGTSKGKGGNASERQIIINDFKQDVKEQAEHVMLVDLARNDLGRLAIPHSVKVDQFLKVEEYAHVFHLTSTVTSKLPSHINKMHLFESTFPAGTLTGAPKVRAMEIIAELETEERGPYGGAFGFFDFNGNIVSSIIIRTVMKKGDQVYIQASAGLVADSVPENEWNETNHKMRTVKQAIFETSEIN